MTPSSVTNPPCEAIAGLINAAKPADVITVYQRCGVDLTYLNELAIGVASILRTLALVNSAPPWQEAHLVS